MKLILILLALLLISTGDKIAGKTGCEGCSWIVALFALLAFCLLT